MFFALEAIVAQSAVIFSRGIRKIPHLSAFLPEYHLTANKAQADCVIGWGLRPSTAKARAFAQQKNLPFIALEDGFLRSVGLGVEGYPPFSMVYDDVGIYYDTTSPSRLEQLILACHLNTEQAEQAKQAMAQILQYQLSKYNHAPIFDKEIFTKNSENPTACVLVIDQTFGDMAVKYGQASEVHFREMLDCAIKENPQAEIWVKTHPDVISGKKKGYLTDLHLYQHKVKLFAEDVNPISLLQAVEKVYCVTSQMGFEALLCGKKVVTFGVPWYAGWGITDDRHPAVEALKLDQRRKHKTLLELFYAAYFQYSRYINPNSGEAGTIFDVIDYLHKAKLLNERLSGNLYCVGMSLWKQAVIKPFFNLPSCKLHFIRSQKKLENRPLVADSKLLVWGKGNTELVEFAKRKNLPILRMEDGFIRSVGLGSNLVAPLSLVVDDLGIYFNAQKTSRLEQILQTQSFSAQDLQTAQELQNYLVASHISKYNVGNYSFKLNSQGKTSILITGQVEDDASIQTGSPVFHTNLDLLKKVRELNLNAYIIYKPHPDVVSGNRRGAIPHAQAVKFADEIVETANVLDCILQVDEVHTMTSLAGFEALLRGKKVYCYGIPFYAGWGLTVDFLPIERRTRKLNLLELVSAVLVYYPLYVDPNSRIPIDAKQAIHILQMQKEKLTYDGIKRSWIAKQLGKLKHLYYVLRN